MASTTTTQQIKAQPNGHHHTNGDSVSDHGPGVVGEGWNGRSFGVPLPSPLESLPGSVTMLDSAVFRTMFGSDTMREIMCDRTYVKRLVEVEVALAEVEGDLGIIPQWAAQCIAKYADASKINLERLRHEVSCESWRPAAKNVAGNNKPQTAKMLSLWGCC